MSTLLSTDALAVRFFSKDDVLRRRPVHAVAGVSIGVQEGEALGLVGESGCGKSSLARAIVGLAQISGGKLRWRGKEVTDATGRRAMRHEIRMVFQDPHSSLNPRLRLDRQLTEPLAILGRGDASSRRKTALAALEAVGLHPNSLARYAHQFSGGQKQRLVIARALVADPALLIADEPVAALDVSVQAKILNLIAGLRSKRSMALLFISHNLAAVNFLCDKMAVMYLGRVVELLPRGTPPVHPYTRALRDAIPQAGRRPAVVAGEPPSPHAPPSGCAYHPRCPHAGDRCRSEVPQLQSMPGASPASGHKIACHFAAEILNQATV